MDIKTKEMTDKELIRDLKVLIYLETRDEIENKNEAFNIGICANEDLYYHIKSLIDYNKQNK